MALSDSALSELQEVFRIGEGTDFIRECVRVAMQELIDAEATAVIGAGRYERTESRTTERNGTRPRLLTTHAGDIQLAVPKLRAGSFFPSILSPRRRIDQALYAVVMEAYVHGVSTRSVDDLVLALGGTGISKSEVSRICAGLDESVGAFRTRRLDHTGFPTSTWTPPICMCAPIRRWWCPKRSWWPPVSPPRAVGKSLVSMSATARTKCSGGDSDRAEGAGWPGSSW